MISIKCDLHIHTYASFDGCCSVKDIIAKAKERGFDAIAITDHDTTEAAKEALNIKNPGILIIPGVEVSTKQGHVLVLGTADNFERGRDVMDTIKEAKEKGCLIIIPHPFHKFRHAVGLHSLDALKAADAIEAYNSRYFIGTDNKKAEKFARAHNKPITAGSDAHYCRHVGYGINIIEAEELSVSSILNAVRLGRIESRCIKTPSSTYTRQSAENAVRKIQTYLR